MWIKLCGMTRYQDIKAALNYGADAVGFIFATSPRQVTPEHVAAMTKNTKNIAKVGVFVDEKLDKVKQVREHCQLDIIQLHGNESPHYCQKLGGSIIKAFRLKDRSIIQRFQDYPETCKILVDAYISGQAGGTGKTINHNVLDGIDDYSRIILAGGIGPDNVKKLINTYHPYGVDVNSKIESSPGIKDHHKMAALFDVLSNGSER